MTKVIVVEKTLDPESRKYKGNCAICQRPILGKLNRKFCGSKCTSLYHGGLKKTMGTEWDFKVIGLGHSNPPIPPPEEITTKPAEQKPDISNAEIAMSKAVIKPQLDQMRLRARKLHKEAGVKYGSFDYGVHLEAVENVAIENFELFIEYIQPSIAARITMSENYLVEKAIDVITAANFHDILEDTTQTYTDVEAMHGEAVAEAVYACTSEKGRYRRERLSVKFYQELREKPLGVFIKICDRYANIQFSADHSNVRKLKMYHNEHRFFKNQLHRYATAYKPILAEMDRIFSDNQDFMYPEKEA